MASPASTDTTPSMRLQGTGIWSVALRSRDPAEIVETAAELEELGYTSLWIPDHSGGAFEAAEQLLGATTTMIVGTGIVSVWVHEPADAAAAHARLRARHGDRFILGIGVSHAPIVAAVAGKTYEKPLTRMQWFLDGLDAAPVPVPVGSRVLAALGPKMLALAASRAAGAHPYNVLPEHTARAREILGPAALLVPEQAVVLTGDAVEGRRRGREFLSHYLHLPNYVNNLRRSGFSDDDLDHGGSDRLVDALIACGDVDLIATRVRQHLDAGADGVCLQVLGDGDMGGMRELPRDAYRELAPAVTAR